VKKHKKVFYGTKKKEKERERGERERGGREREREKEKDPTAKMHSSISTALDTARE
jgi:hypothetical protein